MTHPIERLQVSNFLGINNADLEIKAFNVIIGPQASGKSVLAKLTAFFADFGGLFVGTLVDQDNKHVFDKRVLTKFELLFPRDGWQETEFEISYTADQMTIVISGQLNTNNETQLSINYTEALSQLFNSERTKLGEDIDWESTSFEIIIDTLQESYPILFSGSYFIPASRSLFAAIPEIKFTFPSPNREADYCLKEFGQLYELLKTRYQQSNDQDISILCSALIKGQYLYKNEQGWIINDHKKVNLTHASSGQQQLLPMLLVLESLNNHTNGVRLFIEEPEVHLFPTTQNQVVSLLSLIAKTKETRFFITTHSPYILSAVNNLTLAFDTIEQGKMSLDEFKKLNGPCEPIAFEQVSAYAIEDGKTLDIIDSEYRMIGGDILDEVSEHFETVTNSLLNAGE